jgi:predicted RNA-binding Zn ribbon-like protein
VTGHSGADVPESTADTIRRLVSALADRDGIRRQGARQSLVKMGRPAVAPLAEALQGAREVVRWEAAKALGDLRRPEAAPALVSALEDSDFGVRWLAAQGLISLRLAGLPTLLEALIERSNSGLLREGAHHVLRVLVHEGHHDLLAPVLAALDTLVPAEVPPAARHVLDALEAQRRGGAHHHAEPRWAP